MSKFTPGPWAYKRTHQMSEDTWYVITHHDGRGPVVDVGGKDENGQISEAKHLITNPEEIEANARLIAAAPCLLKALELFFDEHDNTYDGEGLSIEMATFIEKGRAAIAKATKGDE